MQKATLNALASVVSAFQDVAAAIQREISDVVARGDHIVVIHYFNELRLVNEQIKEARKALTEVEDFLSARDIPDLMKQRDIKTITVIGVGRVTVSYRFSCSMLDKERGFDWLRSHGHEGLITETVNSSTLAAFAKDMLQNQGKELPDDIFKTGTAPYTSITKVK